VTEQNLPAAPVYRNNNRDVRVNVYDPPVMGFTPQDLTELGALLASSGFTTMQTRALIAKVQQVAAQAAVSMAPDLLEEIRKIQETRILEILQRIRLLPNTMGWVSRDRVLQIIQDVATKVPRS
jgi:hypothetical protein